MISSKKMLSKYSFKNTMFYCLVYWKYNFKTTISSWEVLKFLYLSSKLEKENYKSLTHNKYDRYNNNYNRDQFQSSKQWFYPKLTGN